MAVRSAFVIQDRRTGLFLAEDLRFVVSFGKAGRLHDIDEALDTAFDNFDPGEFEIHEFLERELS